MATSRLHQGGIPTRLPSDLRLILTAMALALSVEQTSERFDFSVSKITKSRKSLVNVYAAVNILAVLIRTINDEVLSVMDFGPGVDNLGSRRFQELCSILGMPGQELTTAEHDMLVALVPRNPKETPQAWWSTEVGAELLRRLGIEEPTPYTIATLVAVAATLGQLHFSDIEKLPAGKLEVTIAGVQATFVGLPGTPITVAIGNETVHLTIPGDDEAGPAV